MRGPAVLIVLACLGCGGGGGGGDGGGSILVANTGELDIIMLQWQDDEGSPWDQFDPSIRPGSTHTIHGLAPARYIVQALICGPAWEVKAQTKWCDVEFVGDKAELTFGLTTDNWEASVDPVVGECFDF